ncbi:FAD/NAD(P)-binding domain-containing protein [Dendrothele bispora CBS 962.96]|uniref:FAD/NAD(P)-binding domain-containing protein n=1 Tax=Dendrothele bispora (strain CBS 962.96) TaxID=1314807 RepID=A0A4V6T5J6_DENBC|nr:FAD/NAD(P)-binding domain-containing protein [Dendrothele bispora CBS 962.96]
MAENENLNCTLTFAIVGGSIGGLSTAYFLAQAGHKTIVLEKQNKQYFLTQKFTGLRIPPNLTLLLHEIPGMADLLTGRGTPSTGFTLHQGETFELIGQLIYSEKIISDLGNVGYRIPYTDIWRHLYDLCTSHSVEFLFDFEVNAVVCGKTLTDQTKVLSSLKQEVVCDMVVAADGHNSFAREIIMNQPNDIDTERDEIDIENDNIGSSQFSELDSWDRLSIAPQLMQEDPALSSLLESSWEGTDQYGLNIYYSDKNHISYDAGWDPEKLDSISVKEISSIEREPRSQNPVNLSSYTDVTNHLVLIGDAVHAALVNGLYNTALAVEDAFVLGFLFSKLKSVAQIPNLLTGYNDIRKARTRMIREVQLGIFHTLSLPPGPQQDARNQAFGQTLHQDDVNDEILAQLWNHHISTCSYNAKDAVEEWWHNWGTFYRE